MKKLIAMLLLLALLIPTFVACGGGDKTNDSDDNTQGENSGEGEGNGDEEGSGEGADTEKEEGANIKYGAYTLSNVGVKDATLCAVDEFEYGLDKTKGDPILTIYPVTDGAYLGKETYFIGFGDDAEIRMCITHPIPGKAPVVQRRANKNGEQFIFDKQADGTYVISVCQTNEVVLGIVDGKIQNVKRDVNDKTQYWNLTPTEYKQETYSQWISQKGDIYLRLPVDILKTAKTTNERMQAFADDIQKTYDAYIELTKFVPYPAIIVQGSEKQGVMAGVVGNCNTIFINVEWYVDDIAKIQKRWDDGKRDFNFCILHEMGHMFDSGRGWNFESEMEADLKAVYVLYKYQKDDKYGAWAAPAEFAANRCFNYETITVAYDELGDDMNVKYSFYGAAKLFTELVYETGWEPLMKTFHRFQDEHIVQNDLKAQDRMLKFLEFWNSFTDVDVYKFIGPKAMKVLNDKFAE